jgi:hypothetical protein
VYFENGVSVLYQIVEQEHYNQMRALIKSGLAKRLKWILAVFKQANTVCPLCIPPFISLLTHC